MTPRQTRRAKRLRSIRNAALDLVVEDGLENFSVHKLADRCDLTAGALYRYFESRDDMLLAVQVEVLTVFDRYLKAALEDVADERILDRIVYLFRAYAALAELQPQRFQLHAQFVGSFTPIFDEDKAKLTADRTLQMLGQLQSLVQQAEREGQLNEGDSMRRAIVGWSTVHGMVERRKLQRLNAEIFEPEALMNEAITTVLVGWGASQRAVDFAVGREISGDKFSSALEKAQAQDNEEE